MTSRQREGAAHAASSTARAALAAAGAATRQATQLDCCSRRKYRITAELTACSRGTADAPSQQLGLQLNTACNSHLGACCGLDCSHNLLVPRPLHRSPLRHKLCSKSTEAPVSVNQQETSTSPAGRWTAVDWASTAHGAGRWAWHSSLMLFCSAARTSAQLADFVGPPRLLQTLASQLFEFVAGAALDKLQHRSKSRARRQRRGRRQ